MDTLVVRKDLDGWELVFANLEVIVSSEESDAQLGSLRTRVARQVRERHGSGALSSYPAVAALRRLFRAAGCDPTRYRPSSEALLRRLLKGDELPAIHPLVDINNCLSAALAVPCCVMAVGTFRPPLGLRAGRPGESYESLRGPFRLESKPLLCDDDGPLDTPITGSQKVKVTGDTTHAWLVAYLPAGVVRASDVHDTLDAFLGEAPVARMLDWVGR